MEMRVEGSELDTLFDILCRNGVKEITTTPMLAGHSHTYIIEFDDSKIIVPEYIKNISKH